MSLLKQTHLNIARHTFMVMVFTLIMLVFAMVPLGLQRVAGSGTASFGFSPSSSSYTTGQAFTITLTETSSDAVDSAGAKLSYDSSKLTYNSASYVGSPFGGGTCVSPSGGSGSIIIGCALNSGSVTGTQVVAMLNFTALTNVGSANLSIVNAPGTTSITQHSGGGEDWNGVTTSASYSITAPTTGGGGGTTGGGTTGGGSSSTTSGGGSTTKTTTSTPKAIAPAATTPSATTSPAPMPTATTTNTPAPTTTGANGESSQLVPFTILVLGSNGKPQANASVSIHDVTVKTNSQGIARFTTLPASFYVASILLPGAKTATTQTIQVSPKLAQQQLTVKLASSETFLNLQPAEIIAIIIVLLALAAGIAIHYVIEHHLLPHIPALHLGALQPKPTGDAPLVAAVKPAADDAPPPIVADAETSAHPMPGQVIMPAAPVEEPEEPEPTPSSSLTPPPPAPIDHEPHPPHPTPGHVVMPTEPEVLAVVPEPEPTPEPAKPVVASDIHSLLEAEPAIAHGAPGEIIQPGGSAPEAEPEPEAPKLEDIPPVPTPTTEPATVTKPAQRRLDPIQPPKRLPEAPHLVQPSATAPDKEPPMPQPPAF